MEHITFNVSLSFETDQTSFDEVNNLYFENIEELKRFVNDPASFWDYKLIKKHFRNFVNAAESFYYVDDDGNELDVSNLDEDELDSYTVIERSKEDLKRIYLEHMKKYDDYLETLKKGDYSFDDITIYRKNNWTFDDIKKSVDFMKDKVKNINLEQLSLAEIIDLINSVDISDDIELNTRFNYHDTCKCSELKELIDYLTNIKDYISRFDFSPLEICIFVNDLLREREYNEVDNELEFRADMTAAEIEELFTSAADSRSIMRVYKSDKIVCAGFSNLYSAILELFDIKAENISYIPDLSKGEKTGHMSNLVYLNDDKYKTYGMFEVDTTWGRIFNKDKSYNYQKSIYNYSNFMRPICDAEIKKYTHNLELNSISSTIAIIKSTADRIYRLLEMGAPSVILEQNAQLMINKCLKVNEVLKCNYLKEEIELLANLRDRYKKYDKVDNNEFLNVIETITTKVYNSLLNPIGFKAALFRVKMIEHSIDKDKYPFSENDFNEAFLSRIDDIDSLLLTALYEKKHNIKQFDEKKKLKLARMELISTLHKVAGDNISKNPVHHI